MEMIIPKTFENEKFWEYNRGDESILRGGI
jgi:hypothetical protein